MNHLEKPAAENVEEEVNVEHGVLKFKGIAEEFRNNVLSDFMDLSRELCEFLVYNRGNEENLNIEKNKLVTSLSVFKRVVEDLAIMPENETIEYGLTIMVSKTQSMLNDIKTSDNQVILLMQLERFRGEMSGIQTMSSTLLDK